MRILLAALLVAMTALIGAPARAADMPDYPDIEIPEVDYGLSGSFYLRGSAGGNLLWTREHVDTLGCVCLAPAAAGYGYSIGAGFGYEVGNGLRVDVTTDYLSNNGLSDGTNVLHLRAGVALANAYYDFAFGGDSMSGGGWGAGRSSASGRVSNSGMCARRSVPIATLPSTSRARPPRPCVAITTRSARCSAATFAIATSGWP